MRHLFLFLALLLVGLMLFPAQADAQRYRTLFNQTSLANDALDTTSAKNLQAYDRVSFYFSTTEDTVDIVVKVHIRAMGATVWVASDSVNITSTYYDWVLRDNVTELLGGVASEYRVLGECAASGNGLGDGISAPTWTGRMRYR